MIEPQNPAAKATSRRRHLSMLFSDLSQSTELASAVEAEDLEDLLTALREACDDIIPRHGGTIIQVQGDGVFAVFGLPEAGEYDGRRAAEAALELHARIRALDETFRHTIGRPLTMHSGIHSGLVLVEEGDAVRGRLGLTGVSVNIAARLSAAAAADEVLISEETLAAETHFFETGAPRRLQLKGVPDPVVARPVTARALIGTRFAARTLRGLTPFAGRAAELDALHGSLTDVCEGRPGCAVISGSPGLGKTRLAEELLLRAVAEGCHVHRGYCESYLSAEPMQPLLQVARQLCGLSAEMSATDAAEAVDATLRRLAVETSHRDVLLRMLSLNDARLAPADDTVGAIRSVFAGLAAQGPQVLFVDDWQWADDLTRQAIGAVRGLDLSAILVVITSRDHVPAIGLGDVRALALAPLSSAETRTTIERILPGRDPILSADIETHAGGNPLFIEELCHVAQRGGPETWRPRSAGAPKGLAWLSGLIESRLDRLPPEQRELTRVAAVIGNVVPEWLLEAIAGRGADDPAVQALHDLDFLRPSEIPGTLRFKHGVTREVIYASVGLRERRALHLRIAEAFRCHCVGGGEDEVLEPLAYHYAEAGEHSDAARYADLAGDKATSSKALDRAQLQYRAVLIALDQLEPSDDRYERWMRAAQKLSMAVAYDPSREHLATLARAIELAEARDDRIAVAAAEYWLGFVNYGLGEAAAATVHLNRARAFGGLLGVSFDLRITSTQGMVSASANEYESALMLLDVSLAGRREWTDTSHPNASLAYALACKASALGDLGQFDDAQDYFSQALAEIQGAGHEVESSVLCWQSCVWLWQGRWAEALEAATSAQRVAERVKSLYLYTMSVSLGAYAGWRLDGEGARLEALEDATSWLANRGRRLFISLNHGWRADAQATGGQWALVRMAAAHAFQRARAGDRLGEAMACRALARAALVGEAHKTPEVYLKRAMAVADARNSPHERAATALCAAEIAAGRGDRPSALRALDQASTGFEGLGMAWHLTAAEALRQTL